MQVGVQPPLELLCGCEQLTLAISAVLLKCFGASDVNYRDSPVGFLWQSCGSLLALNVILLSDHLAPVQESLEDMMC